MKLNNLKKPQHKKTGKRVGRGPGSGKGKRSGRGNKGAKARSGYRLNPGFQGGDINFIRKLPKRGMQKGSKQNRMRHVKTYYVPINLSELNVFEDGAEITKEILVEKKMLKKVTQKVKILGDGELTRKLNITADRFSKSAKEKIEKAGGKIKQLEVSNA